MAVKHKPAPLSDRPVFLIPYLMKTFYTLGVLIATPAKQNVIKNDRTIQDGGRDGPGFITA